MSKNTRSIVCGNISTLLSWISTRRKISGARPFSFVICVKWSGKLFNLNNRKVVRAIFYALEKKLLDVFLNIWIFQPDSHLIKSKYMHDIKFNMAHRGLKHSYHYHNLMIQTFHKYFMLHAWVVHIPSDVSKGLKGHHWQLYVFIHFRNVFKMLFIVKHL